jgi:hypothetical protein
VTIHKGIFQTKLSLFNVHAGDSFERKEYGTVPLRDFLKQNGKQYRQRISTALNKKMTSSSIL